MSVSSRSANALHALTMLARWRGRTLTSAEIAESLVSNPVLVRRFLGSLRTAGLVTSTEGRHGGWTLAREPHQIALLDVYKAVEVGPVLSRYPHPPRADCEVGRCMQGILDHEFRAAEQAMEERLSQTTVADLVRQVLERARELSPPTR